MRETVTQMPAPKFDPKLGQTEEFLCPWCGRAMRLWRETYKTRHNVHVRASHTHNASDNCKTPTAR
jgi:hypothetical protein